MDSQIYDTLNKYWKTTCKVLLGDEIGDLKDNEDWLKEYFHNAGERKSHLSGKDVLLTKDDYCSSFRVIAMSESRELSIDPLSINEIKDIDSIIEAVSEKWEYTGEKVLGNSDFVELVDLVTDSKYLYDCINLESCNYSAYSHNAEHSKYIFGSNHLGNSQFLIGYMAGDYTSRCFNSFYSSEASDLYLSHNCNGSRDMIFCFHQRNKRNCIGNLELPKEKYLDLKEKIKAEIRDEIKKNGRFPHILELVPNRAVGKDVFSGAIEERKTEENITPIKKSFTTTYKILFKKDPEDITKYEDWLLERVAGVEPMKSPMGYEVYTTRDPNILFFDRLPKKSMVTYNESMDLGRLKVTEDQLNLEKLRVWVTEIGTLCIDQWAGINRNIIQSSLLFNSSNLYKTYVGITSDTVGVSSWALVSKHVYGCHYVKDSQFLINCYYTAFSNRSFELDSCLHCSDSYFSHNCEALSECMFCFNIKAKRYAIGNLSLDPSKYRGIKDSLIEQLADELDKTKELKWNIYNVGCGKQ